MLTRSDAITCARIRGSLCPKAFELGWVLADVALPRSYPSFEPVPEADCKARVRAIVVDGRPIQGEATPDITKQWLRLACLAVIREICPKVG